MPEQEWNLSKFKPIGSTDAGAPAPVDGWDLSKFKRIDGAPAASAAEPAIPPRTIPVPVSPFSYGQHYTQPAPTAPAPPAPEELNVRTAPDPAAPRMAAPTLDRETAWREQRLQSGYAPGPPAAPLPEGLDTGTPADRFEDRHGEGSRYTYNQFGERIVKPELRTLDDAPGILHAPFSGGKRIVEGVEQFADTGGHNKAGGAAKILGGAMEAATPLIPGALARAPLTTGAAILSGGLLESQGYDALRSMGVSEEYAEFFSTLLGAATAGETAEHVGGFERVPDLSKLADRQIVEGYERAVNANDRGAMFRHAEEAQRRQAEQQAGRAVETPEAPAAAEVVETPARAARRRADELSRAATEAPPQPPATWEEAITQFRPIAEEPAANAASAASSAAPHVPASEAPNEPLSAPVAPITTTSESSESLPVRVTHTPEVLEPGDRSDRGEDWRTAPPLWVGSMPTSEIHIDPVRFQYKRDVGARGVSDKLKNVKVFNPHLGGTLAVWRDPADGKVYAVNGHHRHDLAVRLDQPRLDVKMLDAADANEARAIGAIINIAEDQGTSIDAARIFKDIGDPENVASEHGLELKGRVASEGLALSQLAPSIFEDVMSGDLKPAHGAVLGAGLPEHADQLALYDLLKKREKSTGKATTNDQVEELIRLAKGTAKVTEKPGEKKQTNLFGEDEEEVTRALIFEKAEISDYVRKELASEKRLFGAVGSQAAAERLEAGGNVIKAADNAQVAEMAGQSVELYKKLSEKAGPINDILDRASSQLAEGQNSNEVKQRAYAEIRDTLSAQAARLSGIPQASGGPGARNGGSGSDQAGEGQSLPGSQKAADEEVEPPAAAAAPLSPPANGKSKLIAPALRKAAEGMSAQIEAKRNPGVSRQNPTARRANIAAGMAREADAMERVQGVLQNLADAHDRGDVPQVLAGIGSRAAVESLLTSREKFPDPFLHRSYIDELAKLRGKPNTKAAFDLLSQRSSSGDGGARLQGLDEIELVEALAAKAEQAGISAGKYVKQELARAKRLLKAGIGPHNWSEARAAIKDLAKPKSAVPAKVRQIADLERALIGRKIAGFFPTPKELAARMVDEAEIEPRMSILEPSAGNGRIADEIAKVEGVKLTTIEPVGELRQILELKGHQLADEPDFLGHQGHKYDRILMNPPFENGTDIEHVHHAYSLLNPGGKIVAIMGEGAFFRGDKAATVFRAFLEDHGTSEKLPEGTFKQSGTGVASRIVIIEKPGALDSRKPGKPAEKPAVAISPTEIEPGVPREIGPLGPIYTEFHHDAQGALAHFEKHETGDAIGALHHPDVGDFDLTGTIAAKLRTKHKEVIGDLQGFIDGLHKTSDDGNKIQLRNERGNQRAGVRLDFDRVAKRWLVTAFDADARPLSGKTADVPRTGGETREETLAPSEAEPPSSNIPQIESSVKERGPKVEPPDDVIAAAQRLKDRLKDESGTAGFRQKEAAGLFDDLVTIGRDYFARGMKKFGKWRDAMVKALGDRVKPQLLRVWKAVKLPGKGERGSFSRKPAKPGAEPSLFDTAEEAQAKLDAQKHEDKLLGDQLTAQLKSGMAAKPSKLKPIKQRGLFEEEGPEQEGLFGSERGSFSFKKVKTTVSERQTPRKKPEKSLPAAIADQARPALSRVAREGPAGKKLAARIERATDAGERRGGERVDALVHDGQLAKLTREQGFELTDALRGQARPAPGPVKRAYDVAKPILDQMGQEMEAAGIEVRVNEFLEPGDPIPPEATLSPTQMQRRGQGKTIFIRYKRQAKARKYFYPQRMVPADQLAKGPKREDVAANIVRMGIRPDEDQAADFIDAYVDYLDTGKRSDVLIKYLLDTQQVKTPAQGLLKLMRLRARTIKRSGSMEFSREVNLPFWDPQPQRVLPAHVTTDSARMAQIEGFGQDNEAVNELILEIRKAGGDHEMVHKHVDRILQIVNDADTTGARILRGIRIFEGFKLSFMAVANVMQGPLNTYMAADLRAVVFGARGPFTEAGKRFAVASGAATESVIHESMRALGGGANKLLGNYLRAVGASKTEFWNRAGSAIAGADYTVRMLDRLKKNPQDARALAVVERAGIEDVNGAIARGHLTADEFAIAGKRFSDRTQGRNRVMDLPLWMTTELGKTATQFRSYGYNQARLFTREVVDEFRAGRFGRGLRGLLIALAVFPAFGELTADVRAAATGKARPENKFHRFVEDFFQLGTLGTISDLAQAAWYGRIADMLVGPAAGDLATAAEDIAKDIKAMAQDLEKTGRLQMNHYTHLAKDVITRPLGGLGTTIRERLLTPDKPAAMSPAMRRLIRPPRTRSPRK